MMIEQNTNYAYKLKYMDNPTFDKVRDLSTKFYRELPQALQDELFEALNRGIDILDSEPQMTAYLYAFGKMHQAKLEYAFSKLPKEFLIQPKINIIDYGCGQALGTMCYADFLYDSYADFLYDSISKYYDHKIGSMIVDVTPNTTIVRTITLIEPSEICLKRAALHASIFFPNAEIKTINKKLDELIKEDIVCKEDIPTLHIFSNILDRNCYDLIKFSSYLQGVLKGYNQFVCVSPYSNKCIIDSRLNIFCRILNGNEWFYKSFDKFEFFSNDTSNAFCSAQILIFSVGETKDILRTLTSDYEIEHGLSIGRNAVYSEDGKRLLKYYNTEMPQTYSIPDGVVIICNKAFWWCKYIKQVTIPNSVIRIGKDAFAFCRSLQEINIPNSVTHIESCAFSYCESLRHITIPDTIKSMDLSLCFSNCSSLQQFTIPKAVSSIGSFAFCNCSSLQQVIIHNSVKSIGDSAFSGCKSLKTIKIPKSVTEIGYHVFAGCISLQKIIIPQGSTQKIKKMLDKYNWEKLVEE